MTTRNIIISHFPVLDKIYSFMRSIFAAIGFGLTVFWIKYGYEEYYFELSLTFVLTLHSIILILQVRNAFFSNNPIQAERMAPNGEVWEIGDSGDVDYSPIMEDSGDVLARIRNESHTKEGWNLILKRYPRKKFTGRGWDRVRTYILTQMKKVNDFEIIDNR